MPPRAKSSGGKQPKTKEADADAMQAAVAEELGIDNYKQLRATSENLSKSEEVLVATHREEVYANAMDDDNVEDDAAANALADAAAKKQTFKFKLQKAHNKYQKRQASNAADQQPPAAGNPQPGDGNPPPQVALADVDSGLASADSKTVQYNQAVLAAYNRVVGHRVFKNITTQPPNPIQEEDAGDCGVQERH